MSSTAWIYGGRTVNQSSDKQNIKSLQKGAKCEFSLPTFSAKEKVGEIYVLCPFTRPYRI